MKPLYTGLLFLLLISFSAFGQEIKTDSIVPQSLRHFLEQGKVDLHARTFLMGTVNEGELTDYGAWAAGAGLGYQSPSYKNFQFGLSGFFIFKLADAHLAEKDPLTGASNRYEKMLFNLHQPDEQEDLDRLEELYLKYRTQSLNITLGRQKLHTPFLNEQDNRMRPNIFSGLWTEVRSKNLTLYNGWITGITPRGTVNWYSIEESFGVYGMGRSWTGEKADYKGHIRTKGILVNGISWQIPERSQFSVWNYYTEHVFNMSFAQWDQPLQRWQIGVQAFYEWTIEEGGNKEASLSYMRVGEHTGGIGSQLGYHFSKTFLTLNYLGIARSGRYLFPREWGKEPFYVNLARERFEGSGGVQAVSLKAEHQLNHKHSQLILGVGHMAMPDPDQPALSKYGVPSYYHFTAECRHAFAGMLEGLSAKAIIVNKLDKYDTQESLYKINNVNMWNLNLIVDYTF